MKAGSATVWTKLSPSQAGLFRITASLRSSSRQSFLGESVLFPQSKHRLQVHLAWNRKHLLPGGKARLDISVTDEQGCPKKADLGLAVIDQAVYAMTDTRPTSNLERFFIDDQAQNLDITLQSLTSEDILALPATPKNQPLAGALAALLLTKGHKAFTSRAQRTLAQEQSRYQASLKRRLTRALKSWAHELGRSLSHAVKRFWLKYYQHHPKLCNGAILTKLSTLATQHFLPLGKIRAPWGTMIRLSNETKHL